MAISKIITSSLTDDAVTSAKIGTDQVGADALSSSAISGAVDIPANSVGESELSVDYTAQSVPHIIPGVLYPAYNNKRLDGTDLVASTTGPAGSTVASSKYGTVQASDGRMYYYTDIKGSKPIKDPRIGAYFGSQRHKAKSVQLLEQETATHGKNVYSIDGREWMRAVGGWGTMQYSGNGHFVDLDANSYANDHSFIEIVGYFNDANMIKDAHHTSNDVFGVIVNGGTRQDNDLAVTHNSATLGNRYVDAGSLVNLSFNSTPTLGINTLKIGNTNGAFFSFYGIELITQDTSSTANRSKIQIPGQNVVSVGKKFAISATADHYDPFSAKTDGSAWTSPTSGNNTANSADSWPTNIDTANSLGLENWVNGSSYYRPYNGGRVVKYVDSTGTIKTAVTVMPPNARSIGDAANLTGGAEKGDDSAGNTSAAAPNDNYRPTFTDQPIASAEELYEVAKTFHFREFGNGSANAGTAAGSYRDLSMLSGTANDVSYIMDDGLTSLSASDVKCATDGMYANDATSDVYVTFIGTGIARSKHNDSSNTEDPMENLAQNLPYGTHVLKLSQDSSTSVQDITLDGVLIKDGLTSATYQLTQLSFYQPKRPPIPEDAVVLCDYMLMADFVPQGAAGIDKVSKGTRRLDASRDMFYNGSSVSFEYNTTNYRAQTRVYSSQNNKVFKIPSFGRGGIVGFYGASDKAQGLTFKINGTTANGTTNYNHYHDSSVETDGTFNQRTGSNTIGKFLGAVHKTEISTGGVELSDTTTEQMTFECIDLVSPIHTSSHYQSFETPFLHELIGGDRNMEQTNLVCTPDGKTWDEVTRDTSYIGNCVLSTNLDSGVSNNTVVPMTFWRGNGASGAAGKEYFNKDFAIGYDRMICLVAGQYELTAGTIAHGSGTGGDHAIIKVNGIGAAHQTTGGSGYSAVTPVAKINLNRGDYVQIFGKWHGGSSAQYNHVLFTRI